MPAPPALIFSTLRRSLESFRQLYKIAEELATKYSVSLNEVASAFHTKSSNNIHKLFCKDLRRKFKIKIQLDYANENVWRLVGAGITDCKIADILKYKSFLIGTTSVYTLSSFLVCFSKCNLTTDYPRYTKKGYKLVIFARGSEPKRIIHEAASIIRDLIDGEKVFPETREDSFSLLGGLTDFDGYVRGDTIYICRKLHTRKGEIIEMLLQELCHQGIIRIVNWKKYFLEANIKVNLKELRKYVYHIEKRIRIARSSKRYAISLSTHRSSVRRKILIAIDLLRTCNVSIGRRHSNIVYVIDVENKDYLGTIRNTLRAIGIPAKISKNTVIVEKRKDLLAAILYFSRGAFPIPPYTREGDRQRFITRVESIIKCLKEVLK